MRRVTVLFCALVAVVSLNAQSTPAPSTPARAAGPVVGVGNFSHIVGNLDTSLAFYKDVLGLEPANSMPWGNTPSIMQIGGTPGAQSRMAALKVPGSQLGVELIEYKDVDRKPQHARFQDPGAANLALQVRDLSAIVPKIVPAGGKILTPRGEPAALNGNKYVFVQDPDGFVVEIAQIGQPTATAPKTGNILGGAFEATIANSEESVKFYNDLLGLGMTLGASFNDNQAMAATAGTPGASFRQSSATIPGTTVKMTLIEFKNIDRRPLTGRTQDPGTAILQLRVRDVTAVTAKMKAAGARVITTGGAPVDVFGNKIAIVRDPNNLLLELMDAR
jgi:catechol 2,3-dioxygenase-like lactoylglutathione lyase family enzyme